MAAVWGKSRASCLRASCRGSGSAINRSIERSRNRCWHNEAGPIKIGGPMENIWTRSYPAGIPAQIDPAEAASVVALFEESCRRYADRTAYLSMGAELSYGELEQQSRNFAAWLQSVG